MPAERLKDSNFEVSLFLENENTGNGVTTIILDREGHWCDIPVASNTTTFLDLVQNYFKPRLETELQRLEDIRKLQLPHLVEIETILGVGLFYYEPPETDMFEEEAWKGALVEQMKAAGLPIDPVPAQLQRSVNPNKDDFLGHYVDPLDYIHISDLQTTTYILGPAFSRFNPDFLNGTCLAVGYRAAIGVDGTALLGLLKPEQIQTFEDHPEYNRVTVKTVKDVVQGILA